jgi:putative NADPH-quinone reductase
MKILVIDGHPDKTSFTAAVANAYFEGAYNGKHDVKIIKLRDLKFDPILHNGYKKEQKLEKDLVKAQELIKWCEHLVLVTPVWWNNVPALLKGFMDRVLNPGFAFSYSAETKKPTGLLKGRTFRVLYSQASPFCVSFFLHRDCFWKQMKCVFKFCGFSGVKRKAFCNIQGMQKEVLRKSCLKRTVKMGEGGE